MDELSEWKNLYDHQRKLTDAAHDSADRAVDEIKNLHKIVRSQIDTIEEMRSQHQAAIRLLGFGILCMLAFMLFELVR